MLKVLTGLMSGLSHRHLCSISRSYLYAHLLDTTYCTLWSNQPTLFLYHIIIIIARLL